MIVWLSLTPTLAIVNPTTDCNVQKKKENRIHTTQKAKYPPRWIPLKTGGDVMCFRRVSSSCSICGTRHVLIKIFKEISYLRTMIPHQWPDSNNLNCITNVKNVCVSMFLTHKQICAWCSDLNPMWLSRDNDFCFWMHEIIKIINI